MINSNTSQGGTAIPPCIRKIEKFGVNSAQSLDIIPNMTSLSTDFNAEYCGAFSQIGATALSFRRGGGSVEPEGFAILGGGNPDEASGWEVVSSRGARVVRDR